MQRTKNLKCVVTLIIILSLLITIGVAFFRGGSEQESGAHHHSHEKPVAHHNDHEKADVHVHNNLETDNTGPQAEEPEHGKHRH